MTNPESKLTKAELIEHILMMRHTVMYMAIIERDYELSEALTNCLDGEVFAILEGYKKRYKDEAAQLNANLLKQEDGFFKLLDALGDSSNATIRFNLMRSLCDNVSMIITDMERHPELIGQTDSQLVSLLKLEEDTEGHQEGGTASEANAT